jgi:hypothetical protein
MSIIDERKRHGRKWEPPDYLGKLPGLDKKARVAFDWTLDLLFRKDVCAVHNLPPRANVQPLFPTDQGTEVIRPGRIGLSCDGESGSYR